MARHGKSRLQRLGDELCFRLRRRELVGSRSTAREVIVYLIAAVEFITEHQWISFEALLESIQNLGRQLEDASPKELVIGNITRRVIKFLKEEYNTAYEATADPMSTPQTPYTPGSGLKSRDSVETDFFAHGRPEPSRGQSMRSLSTTSLTSHSTQTLNPSSSHTIFDLLGHKGLIPLSPRATEEFHAQPSFSTLNDSFTTPSITPSISRASSMAHLKSMSGISSPSSPVSEYEDFSRQANRLKRIFTEAIAELLDEVDSVHQEIAQQATEHINSGEMILTIGHSRTIESFLKAAAAKRKITVIVAETAPSLKGKELALALSAASIETILVPDACIFALMSRVNKVILGAHAVLADGSFFGISGSMPVCRAAKAHLVPVIVCTGLYKLSPVFLGNDPAQLDDRSPNELLEMGIEGNENIQVKNPYYDKVPAELISLFITNAGGHPSSTCYRLLTDLYGA